jgi:hypothetical protein
MVQIVTTTDLSPPGKERFMIAARTHNLALSADSVSLPLKSPVALAPLGGNAELSRELLFPSLRSGE